jgi:Ca2+-transporting ATPase
MTDASTATGSTAADQAWHAMSDADALAAQQVTAEAGLTTAEVAARRTTYGPNKVAEPAKEPRWQAFLRQY